MTKHETEKIKGFWRHYKKEPGAWKKTDAEYHRLYADLKDSDKEWGFEDIDFCKDTLCGEFLPTYGIIAGDVYIFYRQQEDGNVLPVLYIKDTGGLDREIVVRGVQFMLEDRPTHEIDPELLPTVITKLQELEVDSNRIKPYIDTLQSYTRLKDLKTHGITTEDDIIFVYENFRRQDTTLPRELVFGRCVQEDYDRMSDENKMRLLESICVLEKTQIAKDTSYLERLKLLTRIKSFDAKFFEVTDREILIKTASSTNLGCLAFASEELKNDKNFMLDLALEYDSHGKWSMDVNKIPTRYATDIEVLQALTTSDPSSLAYILRYARRKGDITLSLKLGEKSFRNELIRIYSQNVLRSEQAVRSGFVDWGILELFDDDTLEALDDLVLYGPEPTLEREDMIVHLGRQFINKKKTILDNRHKEK